jgi:predicted MFS family arabinose efflux permease
MNPREERRRLAAVVLAGFCAFLDLYAPQPLLPLLGRLFAAPAARISLLITVSTAAVALTAPWVGLLADRFGRKRVIVPAALLMAVPAAMSATAGSLGALLFWRFWLGVFTPGVFAATVAYIAEEWDGPTGSAVAAYVVGTVVGGFTGRTLAALVAHYASWQLAFVLLGGLNLAGGAAIWFWLPADRHRRGAHATGQAWATIVAHLRNRQLLATYATGFCVLFVLLGTFTYINFYLAAPPFSMSTAALGLLFVVYLGGAAITTAARRSIDRLGHRRALMLAIGGGICGILLTLIQSVPAVMIGLTLTCAGAFIAQSAASSYIGSVTTQGRASAVGLYVTFYYLGGTAGAGLPGRFWAIGGWHACVALIVSVQLLTILLAALFWAPAPNEPGDVLAELQPEG